MQSARGPPSSLFTQNCSATLPWVGSTWHQRRIELFSQTKSVPEFWSQLLAIQRIGDGYVSSFSHSFYFMRKCRNNGLTPSHNITWWECSPEELVRRCDGSTNVTNVTTLGVVSYQQQTSQYINEYQ